MPAVDDFAGIGINASPKAQRCVSREGLAEDFTGQHRLSLKRDYAAHGPSSRQTSPAIAEATHASVVANTESTPSKPGP